MLMYHVTLVEDDKVLFGLRGEILTHNTLDFNIPDYALPSTCPTPTDSGPNAPSSSHTFYLAIHPVHKSGEPSLTPETAVSSLFPEHKIVRLDIRTQTKVKTGKNCP